MLRQVNALAEVEGVLSYDEQCFMPPGAAPARATQKATLAKIRHTLATGDAMRTAVNGVRGRMDELPEDERLRANVRDAIDAFDKEARKSPELAEAEARLESEAFGAWQAARAKSDFSLFAPKLKEMFELKKEVSSHACGRLPQHTGLKLKVAQILDLHLLLKVATVTRPGVAEAYDGALDAFERGMTAARLDELFSELREGLVPLLNAIMAKRKSCPGFDAPHPSLVPGEVWLVEEQAALAREVAAELGYGVTPISRLVED